MIQVKQPLAVYSGVESSHSCGYGEVFGGLFAKIPYNPALVQVESIVLAHWLDIGPLQACFCAALVPDIAALQLAAWLAAALPSPPDAPKTMSMESPETLSVASE